MTEEQALRIANKALHDAAGNDRRRIERLQVELAAASARIAELELEVNQAAGCTVYERPKP